MGSSGSTISGAPSTHEPALPKEAPLHLRAEENGTVRVGHQPAAGAAKASADGLQGGVGVGVGGGQGAEGRSGVVPLVEHLERLHRQAALGEGAGLVEADHVDPGQALHRRQFLHQHPPPPEADHAHGEGHRGQQHQAFGDHGHDAGGGAPQRLLDPDVARPSRTWLHTSRVTVGTITQAMTIRMRLMPLRSSLRTSVKRLASSARRVA